MIVVLGAPKSGTSVMASTLIAGGVTFPYAERAQWRVGLGGYEKHKSDIVLALFYQMNKGDHFYRSEDWDTGAFNLVMKAMDLPPGETGWKVPQSLLYWKEMSEHRPEIRYVGVFRHPKLVQKHLAEKHYLDLDTALNMWSMYAEALLAAHDALGFPLFEFSPGYSPESVQRALGLQESGCAEFDESRLHSGGPSDNPLYHKLRAKRWLDEESRTSSSAA